MQDERPRSPAEPELRGPELRGPELRGHVHSARDSRILKARKIEALIADHVDLAGADMLDLGTGSGFLAEYFTGRARSVTAADRDTSEFRAPGLTATQITGPELPFAEASFDLVLFNHVIEHVGERPAQAAMLDEIRRVLRPGGLLYLAVPNRWALVEPHYRLPLLGALPQSLADAMVRRLRDNPVYECRPYSHRELLAAMCRSFTQVEDVTGKAFRQIFEIERPGTALARLAASVPDTVVRAAVPAMPTLIVLGRKPRG